MKQCSGARSTKHTKLKLLIKTGRDAPDRIPLHPEGATDGFVRPLLHHTKTKHKSQFLPTSSPNSYLEIPTHTTVILVLELIGHKLKFN